MKMFILPAMLLCIYSTLLSQNPLDDFSFQVYYKTTGTDTTVFDSLCTRLCRVQLPDTADIAVIHVKVGTTESGNDILDHGFLFDVSSGLPAGFSYSREGLNVILGLSETYQSDTYYYELILEDSSGNLSTPVTWN